MARLITKEGLLRFQDTNPESRTERPEKVLEPIEKIAPKSRKDYPPFQRAKLRAGEFFLAAGAVPEPQAVN